jgi:hypothetical protein
MALTSESTSGFCSSGVLVVALIPESQRSGVMKTWYPAWGGYVLRGGRMQTGPNSRDACENRENQFAGSLHLCFSTPVRLEFHGESEN